MNQGLEHRNPILGAIAFAAQRGQRQPIRGAISERELAVGIEILLRIDQAGPLPAASMPSYSPRDGGASLSDSILTRLSSSCFPMP
jgi:hypothetical protein